MCKEWQDNVEDSRLTENFPQQGSIYTVDGLWKINKGKVETMMLFPTLFLKEAGNETRVNGAAMSTETILKTVGH